jgi:hypothetical protein
MNLACFEDIISVANIIEHKAHGGMTNVISILTVSIEKADYLD